ncbi:pyridoxamine 5'-phosphate oxidase [Betaproteobacteria bacterium MOLA814]|nr:pyridoxamine 5'-phosphate oxidase [Betaproteobacteria bacterium MOLA814]
MDASVGLNNLQTTPVTASDIRQRIWLELQRAPHDRHHEWRTPLLSSVDQQAQPQARMVVLRGVDTLARTFHLYTDSRSPKVAELNDNPSAALTFWSKRLSWQLRVSAVATVQRSGPEVDAAWAKVRQSRAAGDYVSLLAPGDVLGDTATTAEVLVDPQSPQQHNLAIITLQVVVMDWLELAPSGHRRATLQADAWQWLVP